MMLFLNAQPLLVTTDLVEQARLRILLRKAGIPHRIKLARYSNTGSAAVEQPGCDVDYSHEYTIFVRKKDMPTAKLLYAQNLQQS